MAQVSHNDDCTRFIPGPAQQTTQTKGVSILVRLRKRKGYARKGARNRNQSPTHRPSAPLLRPNRIREVLDQERQGEVISQEPFRVEFHRIGILGWVVQNLPVYQIESP